MNFDKYTIDIDDNPEESAWGVIGRGVGSYNKQQAGENNFKRLCFVLHSPQHETVGGVIAEFYWDWLFIDLLWVEDELRGHGFGHKLLMAIEEAARNLGAKNAYLDTFSFQAPEFYARHGYYVFGELSGFPPGHQRLFMTKSLKDD